MQKSRRVELEKRARQVRRAVLLAIKRAGSGHLAGSLGTVEILTYFYQQVLRQRPQEPVWEERDLFFLSAGHLCPSLYATLAMEGYFSLELLKSLRQFGSPLQGHPHREVTLGLENSAGPLGQGVSLAVGAAYGLRETKRRVFCLSSDGEQDEGQVWEAYLMAAHYHLANFTLLVDVNGIQQSGKTKDILETADLKAKFLAFNFAVGVCDGNDFLSLERAWQELAKADYPKVLLCQTEPGHGVPLLAGDWRYHAQMPTKKQWQEILKTFRSEEE